MVQPFQYFAIDFCGNKMVWYSDVRYVFGSPLYILKFRWCNCVSQKPLLAFSLKYEDQDANVKNFTRYWMLPISNSNEDSNKDWGGCFAFYLS
jgi:hypothetical protein